MRILELLEEAGEGKLSAKRLVFLLWNAALVVYLFVIGPVDWVLLTYVMGLGGITAAGRWAEGRPTKPSSPETPE